MAAAEPLDRVRRMRTRDAAEAENVVSDFYVPHRLTADSPLDARLNVADGQRITFGYLAYGAETELTVPTMVDFFHVNLTLRGSTVVRQGKSSTRTSALRGGVVLSPVEPSTLLWSADAAQFAIKIPVRTLQTHLTTLLHDVVPAPPSFSLAVDLASPAGAGLLMAARFLADQANRPHRPGDLLCEQLESYLLTQVLLGVENSYSRRLASPSAPAGRSQLDDALGYIEAHPERPLGAAELAAVTSAPAAALRTTFQQKHGVAPEPYIRNVRLGKARAELCSGDPAHGSMASIARRWGFARLSRFVADYRSLYGEHPAHTLRRARHGSRGGQT